jgi:Leucine-rich repeat (LRR) protein
VSVSSFKGLENLQHLDLSHNDLKTLKKAAFTPLKRLTWLSLKDNRLSRLHESSFAGLRYFKRC